MNVDKVLSISDDIGSILSSCLFKPSEEKVQKVWESYENKSDRALYAAHQGAHTVAIIGIIYKNIAISSEASESNKISEVSEINEISDSSESAGGDITIAHLAVHEDFQQQGIGRKLIESISSQLQISKMQAETDGEAVSFYKKCGFAIRSLGEIYPGTERFLCTWELEKRQI